MKLDEIEETKEYKDFIVICDLTETGTIPESENITMGKIRDAINTMAGIVKVICEKITSKIDENKSLNKENLFLEMKNIILFLIILNKDVLLLI